MSQVAEQSFNQRVEALSDEHRRRTGAQDVRVFQAPGRVNLLGEHTDYSGGFCMPAALDFNTLVAASPRNDTLLQMYSLDFKTAAEFDLKELKPKGKDEWSAYPAGVAWRRSHARRLRTTSWERRAESWISLFPPAE